MVLRGNRGCLEYGGVGQPVEERFRSWLQRYDCKGRKQIGSSGKKGELNGGCFNIIIQNFKRSQRITVLKERKRGLKWQYRNSIVIIMTQNYRRLYQWRNFRNLCHTNKVINCYSSTFIWKTPTSKFTSNIWLTKIVCNPKCPWLNSRVARSNLAASGGNCWAFLGVSVACTMMSPTSDIIKSLMLCSDTLGFGQKFYGLSPILP